MRHALQSFLFLIPVLILSWACSSDSIRFSTGGDAENVDVGGDPDEETIDERDLSDQEDDAVTKDCMGRNGLCIFLNDSCPVGFSEVFASLGCIDPSPRCCVPEQTPACETEGGYCENPGASLGCNPGYIMSPNELGCDYIAGNCCLPGDCLDMDGICVGTAECPPGTRYTWMPFGCEEPEAYCCLPDRPVACEEQDGYCESPVSSACYSQGYGVSLDPLGCDELGGFCCLPEQSSCEVSGGMCIGWAPPCPETHFTDWTLECSYGQCCTLLERGMCLLSGGYCTETDQACNEDHETLDEGYDPYELPIGCSWYKRRCCLPRNCSGYVGALADCQYQYYSDNAGELCTEAVCMDAPCVTDADCDQAAGARLGEYCVMGNCVYCWQDSQCDSDQVCRTGRCVSSDASCITEPPCSDDYCRLVSPSEAPCPVCVCNSIFSISCARDEDCQIISSHPYRHCVYGRCAECREDSECTWGNCLPPGLCYLMEPHSSALYGIWLIGWSGGMDHYSYFRFEPDGVLRRGSYEQTGAWADDIPNMPCYPAGVVPMPLLGTWEPEITESGFLVVWMSLNISCDAGSGWRARYAVTVSDDGSFASFYNIDEERSYDATRVPTDRCTPDFSDCETPTYP